MTTANGYPTNGDKGINIKKNTQLFIGGIFLFITSSWLAYLCSLKSDPVTFLTVWLGGVSIIMFLGSAIMTISSIAIYFDPGKGEQK